MRQDTEEKILEVFYENPDVVFTVRKIERKTKLPRSTVHKYLVRLKKKNFITKENRAGESRLFKIKKTNFFVEKLELSGLIDELLNTLNPSCIILFGSIQKGESNKDSDIDLFVESALKKEISLSKYENRLKHKIQLFVESDINKLQLNLLNNVVNGIKLYGVIKTK